MCGEVSVVWAGECGVWCGVRGGEGVRGGRVVCGVV